MKNYFAHIGNRIRKKGNFQIIFENHPIIFSHIIVFCSNLKNINDIIKQHKTFIYKHNKTIIK